MAINSQTITHTSSFDVVNGIDGVNVATREIFERIAFENINQFEGLMFRNTFIASNDYEGGMNERVNPHTVSMNNPAGSFRSLLTPKGLTSDFEAITGLGDIKFDKFATDTITLEINDYKTSGNPKLIYEVDKAPGSWLVSDIESAVSGQAISALVRYINYKVYKTIKQGALAQIDPELGAQGRVVKAQTDPEKFTNQFIEQVASLKALPQDRYVTGFMENELGAAISPAGKAKLLEAKLVIYDGQFMGDAGKFFTGLPYTHRIAGVATVETRFLNDGNSADFDYVIQPVGKWSPFLFHLAKFAGRAEVAPFTDGAIGIYGTVLSGMKAEPKLSQYFAAATVEDPEVYFTTTVKKVRVEATGATELTLSFEGNTGDVLYRVSKEGEEAAGAWVAAASPQVISGLESKALYRVEVASAVTGGSGPETVNDIPYVIVKSARTL